MSQNNAEHASNYSQLAGELDGLLLSLERDGISVDELSISLKRGFDLVDALRQRLTVVEAQVEEIVSLREKEAVVVEDETPAT